MICLINNKL